MIAWRILIDAAGAKLSADSDGARHPSKESNDHVDLPPRRSTYG
jgi:hypothetical protein